jgi:hypothetical protein
LGDLDIPKGQTLYFFLGLSFAVIQSYGEQMYLLQAIMIVYGVAKATKHPLAFMPFSFAPRFYMGEGRNMY